MYIQETNEQTRQEALNGGMIKQTINGTIPTPYGIAFVNVKVLYDQIGALLEEGVTPNKETLALMVDRAREIHTYLLQCKGDIYVQQEKIPNR